MPLVSELAPEQLLEEAYKLLVKDQARLGGTNYAPYQGRNSAPMSTLTQKSRELAEQFGQRPAPYTRRIAGALSKEPQGFSPEQTREMLDLLRADQDRYTRGTTSRWLEDQFGEPYNARRDNLGRNIGRDVDLGLEEVSSNLGHLSSAARNLDAQRNLELAKTLQELQGAKQAKRQALVSNLDQFGNQKHYVGNLAADADRQKFEQESSWPQKRMEMLAGALEGSKPAFREGSHPDLQKPAAQNIIKALRAYGVDTSKPTEQWDGARTERPRYPGQLVASITPEMQASYNLLERIDPAMKDSFSNQRKQTVRDMVSPETLGTKALRGVPEAMQPKVRQLENEAEERLKKDMAAINNQYLKLGQFGSGQHISETEERARQINKAMLEQRSKLLEGGIKDQLSLQLGKEAGDMQRLTAQGRAGLNEFGGVMSNLRDMNKLGATKWKNEQDELEDIYKNYQNEALWEWPHMRSAARNEAYGNIFSGAANRGITLDELANVKARYSELERERDGLRSDIKSSQDFYTQRLAQMSQLDQARQAGEAEMARQRADQERMAREASERAAREAAERNRVASLVPQDWRRPGMIFSLKTGH